MKLSNKAQEFLTKLATLCREYNATISGCGCCGSPSLDIDDWSAEELKAEPDQITLGRTWPTYDKEMVFVTGWNVECRVTADGSVELKDPP